jgi:D-alanyl-D-alanine carboxypeptidase
MSTRRRLGHRLVTSIPVAAVLLVVFVASSALANHMADWNHDHSDRAVPPRPNGLAELNQMFGQRCIDRSNNARSFWPHADWAPFDGGLYVEYNTYIARNVGYNVRNHINAAHKDGALYPGIGAYNCRLIDGSTSWSVHSWGAAIDTNWQRNPRFQSFWNGRGIDGIDHGTYIPDVWRGSFPGHRFFWGLNWDTRPDPMHFQYVSNY